MKNTIRKFAAVSLAAALLAGCSSSASTSGSASSTSSGSSSASSDEDKTIIVAATEVPHAEILENVVADVLAEDGWTLEVGHYTDYVTPNTTVEEGSSDANYFQTLGYMEDQNNNGLHLAAVVGVHIEPMGIYSSKIDSIDDLQDGASVAVPNDSDNLDRGLRLLVQKGLLNDPGTTDYVDENTFNGNDELNPKHLDIQPVEAAQVARSLDDVDIAVVNGNYALEADLPNTHPALEIEEFDEETTIRRTNFIVVEKGNEETEKTKALVKAITSDKVKQYIEDTYKGSVIPSFINPDGSENDGTPYTE